MGRCSTVALVTFVPVVIITITSVMMFIIFVLETVVLTATEAVWECL